MLPSERGSRGSPDATHLLAPLPRYCLAGLPVGYQFKNITNADVNNLLLEDLIIWTNYEIEVAAYNSAGLGVYSMKVTEWTLQGGRQGRGARLGRVSMAPILLGVGRGLQIRCSVS